MLLVCASALEEARTKRRLGSAYSTQLKSHDALRAEFSQLLRGKKVEELNALQESVQRKLTSGEPIDVEYWEHLLKELIVYKAKSKLKDMHEVVLNNRLEQLLRKQREQGRAVANQLAASIAPVPSSADTDTDADAGVPAYSVRDTEPEPWDASMEPPVLSHLTNEDRALDLLEDDMDRLSLVLARRKVASSRFVSRLKPLNSGDDETQEGKDAAAEQLYQKEVSKGMEDDEDVFDMEEELSKKTYVWEDKYRPRKPRYFNKVITGFEWNKFNQTHYDHDNPPPKVVMGYRMVLFYPDLIDKTKAPSFRVIKSKENPDVATLVFKAGPPYEDVAFQIVNREWECVSISVSLSLCRCSQNAEAARNTVLLCRYSHKRGFRCSFDRGVLQLNFSFKRMYVGILQCNQRVGNRRADSVVFETGIIGSSSVYVARISALWSFILYSYEQWISSLPVFLHATNNCQRWSQIKKVRLSKYITLGKSNPRSERGHCLVSSRGHRWSGLLFDSILRRSSG